MVERRLEVLVVIDSLVPAGAERSMVQMAPLLVERGVALRFATIHDRRGLQDELTAQSIEVTTLGGTNRMESVRNLSALIHHDRPDLVHTVLFEAGLAGRLAARMRSVPSVSTIASEPYSPAHLNDPRLKRWKVRAAQASEIASLRLARRVHAVSEPVARAVAERLRYPASRIDVVPRGRDPAWLGRRTPERTREARATLGLQDGAILALTVARHEYIKGLDVLIDAVPGIVSEYPNVVFLLAGRPTAITAELAERARRLGVSDRVKVLGERNDIPELLAAADVFLLPTRREGFPGAVVEAMALQVPVVASDIPEVRAVVDESTAILIPPDAPEALARGFREALVGPSTPERVARARLRFEDYLTLDPVVEAMVDFYHRAVTGAAS